MSDGHQEQLVAAVRAAIAKHKSGINQLCPDKSVNLWECLRAGKVPAIQRRISANRTSAQRSSATEAQKRRRADMSEERRLLVRNTATERRRIRRALMSDEEKQRTKAAAAEAQRRRRADMPDEEKQQMRDAESLAQRLRRAALSHEKRLAFRASQAEAKRRRRAQIAAEHGIEHLRAIDAAYKRRRRAQIAAEHGIDHVRALNAEARRRHRAKIARQKWPPAHFLCDVLQGSPNSASADMSYNYSDTNTAPPLTAPSYHYSEVSNPEPSEQNTVLNPELLCEVLLAHHGQEGHHVTSQSQAAFLEALSRNNVGDHALHELNKMKEKIMGQAYAQSINGGELNVRGLLKGLIQSRHNKTPTFEEVPVKNVKSEELLNANIIRNPSIVQHHQDTSELPKHDVPELRTIPEYNNDAPIAASAPANNIMTKEDKVYCDLTVRSNQNYELKGFVPLHTSYTASGMNKVNNGLFDLNHILSNNNKSFGDVDSDGHFKPLYKCCKYCKAPIKTTEEYKHMLECPTDPCRTGVKARVENMYTVQNDR